MFKYVIFVLFTVWMGKGTAILLPDIGGTWEMLPSSSSEIDLLTTMHLDIEFPVAHKEQRVVLRRDFGPGIYNDTLNIPVNTFVDVPIENRNYPLSVFMGLRVPIGTKGKAYASVTDNILNIRKLFNVSGSQGYYEQLEVHRLHMDSTGELLVYTINRESRPDQQFRFEFKRKGSRAAYVIHLDNNWSRLATEGLIEKALLLSLQGLANRKEPILYFVYDPAYDFTFTQAVFDFYRDSRYYTFTELTSAEQAFDVLGHYAKGYVVYDTSVRETLMVAYTIAGLYDAVVVDTSQVLQAERLGLKCVADLTDKFRGSKRVEVYQWAYDNYYEQTNKDLAIWLGGVCGDVLMPGIADWGVQQRSFVTDLSTDPATGGAEYELALKIMGGQNNCTMVMGWHSYCLDSEHTFVAMSSSFGLRVEGLNTNPNLSFGHKVTTTPGFKFTNNHYNPKQEEENKGRDEKIYIAAVQTDGIGLGAWTKPGRGAIPYAWEVTMNYVWLAPAMLEFFYSQATPNDFFIGSLSGPGYMYPKMIPPEFIPRLFGLVSDMMRKLDLNVFEVMDYSHGTVIAGNTDLPKRLVDAYYDYVTPASHGFLNGYGPSFTFADRDARPFISYDYYLSPTRSDADAALDIKELALINSVRPYFMLLHVREYSSVTRVADILSSLGDQYELVHLERLMELAGQNPTFKTRYEGDP